MLSDKESIAVNYFFVLLQATYQTTQHRMLRNRLHHISLILLLIVAVCLMDACNKRNGKDKNLDMLFLRAADSIENNRGSYVLRIVEDGHASAADSDTYYLFSVLKAKYELISQPKDSFLRTNSQIKNYIDHQPDRRQSVKRLKAEWLRLTGTFYQLHTSMLDSAIEYQKQAIALLEKLPQQKESLLRTLINLADAYKFNGNYAESAQTYKRCLALAEENDAQLAKLRPALLNGVASAYTAMEDFEQGDRWWQLAEKELPQMTLRDKFLYYNNRGTYYYLRHSYDSCRKCLENADSLLAKRSGMEFDRMFCRTNLADACLKSGDIKRATALLDEVEPFFRKHHTTIPLFYIDTQRIELAVLQGNTTEALQHAQGGMIPEDIIADQKMMRLSALEKLYAKTGDINAYIRVSETKHALSDSLEDNKLRMQFSEKLMQYQRDAKVTEQQRTIERKEAQTRWLTTLLIAAAIVLILTFIILYQLQRQRKLKEQQLIHRIMELRMDNIRNRITPHFIYNALSHEMLAQMNGRKVNLETLVRLLRRGGQMADGLCTSLQEEMAFIDYYVAIEAQSLGDNFSYTKSIDNTIDMSAVKLPSMTVQIFVENAIKHGLKGKAADEKKILNISIRRDGQGTRIEVRDNGAGTTTSPMGTGLKVVSQTIALLNEQNLRHIDYGNGNTPSGYCSWLYLPDNYDYEFKK